MRKIEQDIIEAIRNKRNFSSGHLKGNNYTPEGVRDKVICHDDGHITVRLWDNPVAVIRFNSKELMVSDCGYATPTTTSRLNAVFAALNIPMAAVIRKGVLCYTSSGKKSESNTIQYDGWKIRIA